MRKTMKLLFAGCALLTMTSLLVACGGKSDGVEASKDANTQVIPPQSAPPQKASPTLGSAGGTGGGAQANTAGAN